MLDNGRAEDIAEDLLYRTGQALKTGDLSDIPNCFELPQYMQTIDGRRFVDGEDILLQIFVNMRKYFRDNDVTDIVRTVVSSEFVDANTIATTHVSRLIQSGGRLFRAPYPCFGILRRSDGAWRIGPHAYAILDAPEQNRALVGDIDEDPGAESTNPF